MSDTFTVTREARIGASPEVIRNIIENFRAWPSWSPWEELDPNVAHEYGGNLEGVGSWTTWSGNRKAGQGRMEITGSDDRTTTIDLRFIKPFKTENTTTFTLVGDGDGTKVTWSMTGPMTFITKLMGIIWPMDKMVGKDFEKGLANLTRVAESAD